MKIFTFISLALTFSLLIGCTPATNDSGKTISLFNGKNLDGWEIENNGQFSVENGVLKLNQGTGWLRSSEAFADFTMTMEFRFLEKDENSGIFVRTEATSKDDENGWPDKGYQIQCIDMIEYHNPLSEYPLGHMIPYGAPEFQSVSNIEALKEVYKPAGEWHT